MRISDWSSDVCSSDLGQESANDTEILAGLREGEKIVASGQFLIDSEASLSGVDARPIGGRAPTAAAKPVNGPALYETVGRIEQRSEEHTSELQSLMRISYAVFCLKKKKILTNNTNIKNHKKCTPQQNQN